MKLEVMMAAVAAYLFSGLMSGLAVFQLALASGMPIGQFAWGGQHRVLPNHLRVGSLVSILIYTLLSAVVLVRAGVLEAVATPDWAGPAAWAVVAYLGLGIPLNAVSRSVPERLTMTPLVTLLVFLATVVALS